MASISFDITLRLWNVSTGEQVIKHNFDSWDVEFSPDVSPGASHKSNTNFNFWKVSSFLVIITLIIMLVIFKRDRPYSQLTKQLLSFLSNMDSANYVVKYAFLSFARAGINPALIF